MNIVTVTLNPALDKTASLETLLPGELNRLREVVMDAGGKGVNVSKMIAALGGESVATGFVGGGSGDEIVRALDAHGIRHDFVRIAASTRTNLKILDQGDRLTELNEPGPEVTEEELEALYARVEGLAGPETLFVFSGSVPRGVDAGVYGRLVAMAKAKGAQTFLDADGTAFRIALEAGPDFIKPNRHELLEYFSQSKTTELPELAGLCKRLLDKGVRRLAMSMGRHGALFADESGVFYAPGLEVTAQSSVGAGDSMVGAAAWGTARGMAWRDIAVVAMAASAGAVTTTGTKPPSRELVEELKLRVELRPVS